MGTVYTSPFCLQLLPALWHFCISLVNYMVDVPIATLLVEVSVKKIQTLS